MEEGNKKSVLKKVTAVLGALVVALVAFVGWAYNYYDLHAPKRDTKEFSYVWQWALYAHGMNQADKNDTYGGATPEETLALYIAALEKGDIDLASLYYLPEKKYKAISDLTRSKNEGGLSISVKQLKEVGDGKFLDENTYSYSVLENNQFAHYLRLQKNIQSNIWKISEP